MAKAIVALFDDHDDAQRAVDGLVQEGFRREDVNLMAHSGGKDTAYNRDSRDTDADDNRSFGEKVSHFFGSLFGDDDDTHYYSEAVRRGGTAVTVTVQDNMVDRATDILERYNPVDIDERAAYYKESGYTGFDASAPPYGVNEIAKEREMYRGRKGTEGEVKVPIVKENIDIGKREVNRGGVRVRSRVVETPVEENVRLREERVSVDRRPVDRPVTQADLNSMKEGTIEMTETAEEPVVAKNARVVEEVVVNKEVGERTETVRDTVRRTDVDVEDINKGKDVVSKKARNRS